MTLTPTDASRAVLITGCSSGIGRAIAIGLQQRGYRVFASVRQAQDIPELKSLGLDSLQLDLADSGSINSAVDQVLAQTQGQLYALVNNGAYGQPGAVEDLSRDTLRSQFETNLFGTHELTNRLIPTFRAANNGRIIQISSLLGYVCLPYRGAYNASKYALEALSDTLRLELHSSGIKISLIEPGPIRSRFRANAYAAYQRHIDAENSPHRALYTQLAHRLLAEKSASFTLPAEAVLAPVLHALENKRPRIRYRVTFPAHLLATLKRLLPDRWLDYALKQISEKEQPPK
ncbi:MAG: SDR family NAD(P)-dependent oxidoreductase [Gammaproteobacteria bacterium]|nr:SDR family NAD(P)-dependent oxidoreductase [Gammaproteobacteria bacterium]